MLILTAISGPHTGTVLELPEDKPAVLGRLCGPLPLRDSKASGYHADLWHEQGAWYVSDHQSRNGTFVNRQLAQGKTRIDNGSLIQVGRTAFAVTIMDRAAAGAGADLAHAPRVTAPANLAFHAQTSDSLDEADDAHGSDAHTLPALPASSAPAGAAASGASGGSGGSGGASGAPIELPAHIAQELAQHVVAALRDAGDPHAAAPQALLESILDRLDRQEETQARILAAAARQEALQAAAPPPAAPAVAPEPPPDPRPLLEQIVAGIEAIARDRRQTPDAQPALDQLKPALDQILTRLDAGQSHEQRLSQEFRDALAAAVERSAQQAGDLAAASARTSENQLQALRDAVLTVAAEQSHRDERLLALLSVAATAGPEAVRPALEPLAQLVREQGALQTELARDLRDSIDATIRRAAEELASAAAARAAAPREPATDAQQVAAEAAQRAAQSASQAAADAIARLASGLQEHQARQERLAAEVLRATESLASRGEPALQEVQQQLRQHAAAQADLAQGVRDLLARPVPAPPAAPIPPAAPAPPPTAQEIAAPLVEQLAAPLADRLVVPLAERNEAQAAKLHQTLAAFAQMLASRGDASEPLLTQIARRLEDQGARQEAIAAALENVGASQAQLGSTTAQFGSALAQLGSTATAAQAAANAAQNASLAASRLAEDSLASQLRAQESHKDELLAALRDAARGQAPRLESLVAQVLVQMQDQAVRHEQLGAMFREALAARPGSPDPALLTQVAQRLAAQDARQDELLASVRQIQSQTLPDADANADHASAPAQTGSEIRGLLERVVAALELQHQRHEVLAHDVRAAAQRPASDPLLQHIVARLDAQDARQSELLQAVRQSIPAAPVAPVLESLVVSMERQESLLGQWRSSLEQSLAAGQSALASRHDEQAQRALAATQSLEAQIRSQEDRHNQLVAAVREAARAGVAQGDPALAQIAAQLEAQAARQEQLLASMRELAQHRDAADAPSLRHIVEALAQQAARQDELVAAVRLAADAPKAQLEPRLLEIRDQLLAQAQLHQDQVADLRRTIESRPARQEALLAQLIVQLQDQAQRHEQLANLWRDAARDRASEHEPALRQAAQRLAEQASALQETLATLRAPAPAPASAESAATLDPQAAADAARLAGEQATQAVGALLDRLAADLREQGDRHALALEALRDAAREQARQTPSLLAPLADQLREQGALQLQMLEAITRPADASASATAPADPLAPVALEQLRLVASQVDAQAARQEEFLAALRQAQLAAAADSQSLLQSIAQQVESQAQRHDQLLAAVRDSAQRQADALAAGRPEAQAAAEALANLTDRLAAQDDRHRQLLDAVRQAGQSAAAPPMLDQIASRLEAQAREHGELLSLLLAVRKAQLDTPLADRFALAGASPRLMFVPAPGAPGSPGSAASGPPGALTASGLPGESPDTEPLLREIMAEHDARQRRYAELSAAISAPVRRRIPRALIAASILLAGSLLGVAGAVGYSSFAAPRAASGSFAQADNPSQSYNQSVPQAPAQKGQPLQQQQQRTLVPPGALAHAPGLDEPGSGDLRADPRAERFAGQNEAYRDILGRMLPAQGQSLAWNPPGSAGAHAAGPGTPSLFSQFDRGDGGVEAGSSTPIAPGSRGPNAASSPTPGQPPLPLVTGADRGLTRLQRAYKLAFETNWPVTIGTRVEPTSGRMIDPKTLDPAPARAAGITRWEDWYKMDDDAEQRRLQVQLKAFEAQRKGQIPFNLGDPIRTMPPATQPTGD